MKKIGLDSTGGMLPNESQISHPTVLCLLVVSRPNTILSSFLHLQASRGRSFMSALERR